MAIVRKGGAVRCRSDWLGAAPWRVVLRAAEDAGLVLAERGRGAGVSGTFTDGWLRLEGATDAVVRALQLAMARAAGRDVERLAWRAEARLRAGAVDVDATIDRTTAAPDGSTRATAQQPVEVPFAVDVEELDDDVLDELLADTEGAVVELGRVLDGPLAHLHPELRWRDVRLVVPPGWAPPNGADLELAATGELVPGPIVAATLRGLGVAVDEISRPPDLERWTIRAARRAGLTDPPSPSDSSWPTYHAVWLDLTASERARPSAPGKVAAWRFRTPGEWIVPPAECALLRSEAPSEPPSWRAALERGAAGDGCAVRVREVGGPSTPWEIEPVVLRSQGPKLIVLAGEQVVVEASRADEGVEVLWTDGIEPEVAASQLAAALRDAGQA